MKDKTQECIKVEDVMDIVKKQKGGYRIIRCKADGTTLIRGIDGTVKMIDTDGAISLYDFVA
jgi:hypothetical protein